MNNVFRVMALFDARLRGEDMASLVGDPKLGSPTMYKLKSMREKMKSLG
ncbi:hypothetical protein [Lignipirellula cremea]|uniref:Uncharacterized protein n=1 Tax=Lignipirellula cremea TaxID=2528010 RepID=A0A518DN55_9BACT|nr:hypothetical protein [Lignipirellula cremea]QDU93262.1 hypothetical protein Pla8534_10410 [Lignipirellula cremea]